MDNQEKKFSVKWLIAIVVIFVLLFGSCGSSGNDYDDLMSSQDWGPNHYYDRGTHQVEEKFHW